MSSLNIRENQFQRAPKGSSRKRTVEEKVRPGGEVCAGENLFGCPTVGR